VRAQWNKGEEAAIRPNEVAEQTPATDAGRGISLASTSGAFGLPDLSFPPPGPDSAALQGPFDHVGQRGRITRHHAGRGLKPVVHGNEVAG